MPGVVEVMETALVVSAVGLAIGIVVCLTVLIGIVVPGAGVDRMPIPPGGVPEHAAAVSARISAHIRDRGSVSHEPMRSEPEPIRLHLVLGRQPPPNDERAAA